MNPIQQLIIDYHTREAFWAAAENVEQDTTHQAYFLRLLRARNNVVQLQEDLPRIQQMADGGNPYMQYALARLHDCLQFQPNSNDTSPTPAPSSPYVTATAISVRPT